MENGTASVLASIEPVIATLVGLVLYRETLNGWNILGICLVLFSIVLINCGNIFQTFSKKPLHK
jgi:drug/metabolite transporter (DMT)-like permease